jgi:hypothetical protein
MWTNWFMGGVSLMDPWTANVQLWIPTWYFLILAWAIGCQWYAHRCTVYDNLIKDEIGQQILPKLPIPPVDQHAPSYPSRVPAAVPKIQPPQKTQTSITPTFKARSADAEAALQRLRKKWVRSDSKPNPSS